MASHDTSIGGISVIYDGECPFCASYVSMMRLRQAVGPVDLVDARSGDPRVREVVRAGHDLDAGMVVLWQDEIFYGDRAVHLLATLSSEGGGPFNRLQRAVFANPRRAARLYPVLAFGRRLFLRLIGRQTIADAAHREKTSRG